MPNTTIAFTRSLTEAVGLAVLTSIDDGLTVVGRMSDGDGQYVVGRRLPACLVVGCARDGRWFAVAPTKYTPPKEG